MLCKARGIRFALFHGVASSKTAGEQLASLSGPEAPAQHPGDQLRRLSVAVRRGQRHRRERVGRPPHPEGDDPDAPARRMGKQLSGPIHHRSCDADEPLPQSIILSPVWQELNLSFGEITGEAALTVAKAVKGKDQLEKLDLNGTNLWTQALTWFIYWCLHHWRKCGRITFVKNRRTLFFFFQAIVSERMAAKLSRTVWKTWTWVVFLVRSGNFVYPCTHSSVAWQFVRTQNQ